MISCISATTDCFQYRESDLDYCRRLLAEEGLSFRFSHDQNAVAGDEATHARHRLEIFDRETELPELAQPVLRFHRNNATEASDTVQTWQEIRNAKLKSIQKVAPKYLDDAQNELKKMHAKTLDDIAPASTAAKSTPTGSRAVANAADAKAAPPPKPAERKSGSTTRKSDQTPDNQGMADTRKHDQPREARKKKDNWRTSILPEHITDYQG